jgi:hypothetical protein
MMRKAALLLAAAFLLAGCQLNLATDRVTGKMHIQESHTVTENTTVQELFCTENWGVFIVVANDPKHAQCDVREQYLIKHGKKGGAYDWVEASKAVYDQIKVGDKWNG